MPKAAASLEQQERPSDWSRVLDAEPLMVDVPAHHETCFGRYRLHWRGSAMRSHLHDTARLAPRLKQQMRRVAFSNLHSL